MDIQESAGRVVRVRGSRLYLADGSRRLDLEREGARLVAGTQGGFSALRLKSLADRGLFSRQGSAWIGRFLSQVRKRFPGFHPAALWPSEAEALAAEPGLIRWKAFECPGFPPELLSDPSSPVSPSPGGKSRRNPFALPGGDRFLLTIPVPEWMSPGLVIARGEGETRIAPSGIPVLKLAIADSALETLESLSKVWNEGEWALSDRYTLGVFHRNGPYLNPRCAEADYPALRKAALSKGILLSRDHGIPSILPPEFSPGELAPILKL